MVVVVVVVVVVGGLAPQSHTRVAGDRFSFEDRPVWSDGVLAQRREGRLPASSLTLAPAPRKRDTRHENADRKNHPQVLLTGRVRHPGVPRPGFVATGGSY